MMYSYKHIIPLSVLCCVLAACTETDVLDTPTNAEKTAIELNVGKSELSSSSTRAVITDGIDKPLQAFNENTSLYMLLKSEHATDQSKSAKVTRTIMFAQPKESDGDDLSKAVYEPQKNDFVRYWEDSYSRSSALSILAVCTPGMGYGVDNKTWSIGNDPSYVSRPWTGIPTASGDVPYTSIVWPVGNGNQYTTYKLATDQSVLWNDVSFIKNQDLCFSNNIGKHGDSDARLKFNSSGDHKFDAGTMIFYHALSKFTFKVKKGEGFTTDNFKFKDGTNLSLTNMNSQGTFNIEEGEFIGSTLKTTTIEKIFERALTSDETNDKISNAFEALVIPGTDMSTSDYAISFEIADNVYRVTRKQLYDAIINGIPSGKTKAYYFDGESGNKLKAGIHYVITFTVGKSKIDKLTAQLVEWETIEAEATPSNATIKVQLEERGEPVTSGIELYRMAETAEAYNWTTGYTNEGNGLSYSTSENYWTTSWFWPDNQTYYHLRALGPTTQTVTAVTDGADYTSLSHSETVDVLWGAPFKDDGDNETAGTFKFNYGLTKNGFDGTDNATDHQIYHAIGATSNTIKMLMFHLLSNVNFRVQTTTGDDKVELVTGEGDAAKYCTITLKNVYTTGTALLSNGLVKESGTRTSEYQFSVKPTKPTDETYWLYNYYAIPQELIDDVVVVITTPDNNQYEVQLNKLKTTAVTDNNLNNPYTKTDGKYTIDRWYPHYQYTYTFTLKKTGIADVQVTILDWEKVEADPEEVEIK